MNKDADKFKAVGRGTSEQRPSYRKSDVSEQKLNACGDFSVSQSSKQESLSFGVGSATKEKLESLKKSMDKFHASCEKIKSSEDEYMEKEMEEKICEESWKIRSEMYSIMDNIYKEMYSVFDNLYSEMYKHEDGHMPKLKAGQMQKLLDVCGASEDYELVKPKVYISASSKNKEDIILNYKKGE